MDVPEQHARRLAELAAATPCDNDHVCLKSNPEELCRARFTAERNVVYCLEEKTGGCRYSIRFGRGVICACLVRQYIAEHLHQ
ncbi:MAG: hypothetical protein ACYTAS_24600 [Planctomycetota bacterium]|jgi:hypothetical protein